MDLASYTEVLGMKDTLNKGSFTLSQEAMKNKIIAKSGVEA